MWILLDLLTYLLSLVWLGGPYDSHQSISQGANASAAVDCPLSCVPVTTNTVVGTAISSAPGPSSVGPTATLRPSKCDKTDPRVNETYTREVLAYFDGILRSISGIPYEYGAPLHPPLMAHMNGNYWPDSPASQWDDTHKEWQVLIEMTIQKVSNMTSGIDEFLARACNNGAELDQRLAMWETRASLFCPTALSTAFTSSRTPPTVTVSVPVTHKSASSPPAEPSVDPRVNETYTKEVLDTYQNILDALVRVDDEREILSRMWERKGNHWPNGPGKQYAGYQHRAHEGTISDTIETLRNLTSGIRHFLTLASSGSELDTLIVEWDIPASHATDSRNTSTTSASAPPSPTTSTSWPVADCLAISQETISVNESATRFLADMMQQRADFLSNWTSDEFLRPWTQYSACSKPIDASVYVFKGNKADVQMSVGNAVDSLRKFGDDLADMLKLHREGDYQVGI